MSDFNQMTEAKDLLDRVDTQVAMLASAENGLERGYAHLGYMLLEVYEMKYWRVHFESFRAYLESLADKFNRSVGRLQQYFLAVRDLSDTFNNVQLESMGITKAVQLRQAKDYALVLPESLKKAALDPKITVQELRKIIAKTLNFPNEEGDWMDLEFAFVVTPEQRTLFEETIRVAMHTDPVTKSTISKSAQMLDVMTKLSQEFLGAHAGDGQ